MILGFKTKINGKPTYFVEKILAYVYPEIKLAGFKPKLHTIRSGKKWKPNKIIHMAVGVRTSNYKQFNKGLHSLSVCKGVQYVEIIWQKKGGKKYPEIFVDKKKIVNKKKLELIAINDGFESINDFFKWFNEDYKGKIIHWTDLKY